MINTLKYTINNKVKTKEGQRHKKRDKEIAPGVWYDKFIHRFTMDNTECKYVVDIGLHGDVIHWVQLGRAAALYSSRPAYLLFQEFLELCCRRWYFGDQNRGYVVVVTCRTSSLLV